LQRLISVPSCHLEIQTTPPLVHAVLASVLQPILVAAMPRVAETFKGTMDKIIYGTNFPLVNLLDIDNENLTHGTLNSSIDELEYRRNIHLVLYDIVILRATPSSNR